MAHPRIFVTRELPPAGPDLLRAEGFDVDVYPGPGAPSAVELRASVRDAQALLCLLSDRVDWELLEAAPRLEIVANYAVGYDNVDLAAATAHGVWVTNTPGVLTEATADLAFALLLACARRVVEGDRLVREGRFAGWGPLLLLGLELSGATLGVLGMGRIGQAVCRRARGFGMQVLYHGRSRLDRSTERRLGASWAGGLEELLARSDAVSLHVPGGPSTHHLLGARELGLLRPGAVLVNTARGTVVDEAALVAALSAGRLRAAGLDVYEREPALAPGLAELPNVVLAPHVGSATEATRARMAEMAARNIVAVLRGQRPPNAVNDPEGGGA